MGIFDLFKSDDSGKGFSNDDSKNGKNGTLDVKALNESLVRQAVRQAKENENNKK